MLKTMDRRTRWLCLCTLGYALLYLITIFLLPWKVYRFLTWNIFLSWLPIFFTLLAHWCQVKSKKALSILFVLLWLLFFPNAPYLITDLLHIGGMKFYGSAGYITEFGIWFKLFHAWLCIFLGVMTGLYSLYIMQQKVAQWKGKITGYCFLGGVCLLSGFAIYIGRFLRINSWDVLHPLSFFEKLGGASGGFSLKFTLLMALCILFTYLIVYTFFQKAEKD